MSLVTKLKVYWALLPANVQLAVHGAGSAAAGGAFTAAVAYFSDHGHHTIIAVKESVGIIAAGAIGAVLLYFKVSPVPGWRWDRAIEQKTTVERRKPAPVLPPEVVVLPETPPGDPPAEPPTVRPLVDVLRERRATPRDENEK